MPESAAITLSTANRWLLVFSIGCLAVLVGGTLARRSARHASARRRERSDERTLRGMRRRSGALVALGPLVGLAFATDPGDLTVVAALGAVALAAVGALTERDGRADGFTLLATVAGGVAAVVAGARFGPTGVEALDVGLAFLLVVLVTQAVDGLGNVDGLAVGVGTAGAGAIFGLAAFAGQDDLASVSLGLVATCFAFRAFNTRPASLFIGRGGRLAIGYVLSVGALGVDLVPGPARSLATPLIILGLVLLDAAAVVASRLRRRRSLAKHRSDHLVHRLAAIGWTAGEAVGFLVAIQLVLSVIALFTGRAVLPVWVGVAAALLVLVVTGVEAARGKLDRGAAEGFGRGVWIGVGVLAVVLVAAIIPTAIAAPDAADQMLDGRDAASRALTAARDGDTETARVEFEAAARSFADARDTLESPLLSPGLAVPGLASNLNAARELADIGTDLATSGVTVSTAVNPEALSVVDGRLPIEEVVKVTPALEEGAVALTNALDQLDDVRDDPYLAGPVKDAVEKIHDQLVQAEREARHASAAAKLAPALFGGDGPRRYLLVVQNNAEARATGGFIGSFGIVDANAGKLSVGELQRTREWNEALRALETVTYESPDDYRARYTQYRPDTNLQNVNISPDFPSVAQVLMSLAPQAGVGAVDGVIAVDPDGLAALLELTGPVTVPEWPTPIDATNVVDVTLRQAYEVYPEDTPTRIDFLGSVTQAAVDAATSDTLGQPADIARVLGAAAHKGHFVLAFARPEEQALSVLLDTAQEMRPVASDSIALTTSNAGGNKIDYFLDRSVDYQVTLAPDENLDRAQAIGTFEVTLDNTAPAEGPPQIVIGPFNENFEAGVNRSIVSLYSPLQFVNAAKNGESIAMSPGRERNRSVYSMIDDIPPATAHTLTTQLGGEVELREGWYTLEVRNQPMLIDDDVRLSIEVVEGWKIDKAPGMERPFDRRATAAFTMDQTRRYRVHVTRDLDTWDLWDRLETGT